MKFYINSFILILISTSLNLNSMEKEIVQKVPTLLEITTYNLAKLQSKNLINYDILLSLEEINHKINLKIQALEVINKIKLIFPEELKNIITLKNNVLYSHINLEEKVKLLKSFIKDLNNNKSEDLVTLQNLDIDVNCQKISLNQLIEAIDLECSLEKINKEEILENLNSQKPYQHLNKKYKSLQEQTLNLFQNL